MKLELKHLAAYLPHKVMVSKMHTLNIGKGEGNGIGSINHILSTKSGQYKMWLRPLSDLTKEIEVNGEKFVPIDWLEDKYFTLSLHKECERLLEEDGFQWINHMSHLLIIHLMEWHFDIFGLIDAGLAVDINTVK